MAKKNINITLEDNDPIYINLQKINNKFLRTEFIKHVLYRATMLLEDGSDVFETISKFNNLLDNKRGSYNKKQEPIKEDLGVFPREQTDKVELKPVIEDKVSNQSEQEPSVSKPKLKDLLKTKGEDTNDDDDNLLDFRL